MRSTVGISAVHGGEDVNFACDTAPLPSNPPKDDRTPA